MREQRNAISAKMKGGRPDQELIDQGKQLKIELAEREGYLKSTEEKVDAILKNVPNITFDDVPLGGEEDSVEIKALPRRPQALTCSRHICTTSCIA